MRLLYEIWPDTEHYIDRIVLFFTEKPLLTESERQNKTEFQEIFTIFRLFFVLSHYWNQSSYGIH